ncbi:hypothetical protein P7K49_006408 [Saguinus oedipus]|uniref:Uncharacterized protein n=1 Tax=Saguinus oedipus TaxID=9490 RepID=A0ABQ9W2C1_SAGOE|nr:hypothetical protein P7K49_006408 [Saguinus oedipus]
MITAEDRIHCLQFLQVQVQGMFSYKSDLVSKGKKLEENCNGDPCFLAVLSTGTLRRKSSQATLLTARAASWTSAVSSAAAAPANVADQGAIGEQCGQYPFFPTPHLLISTAVESQAEPLPSHGDRPELCLHHGFQESSTDQDPASRDPAHSGSVLQLLSSRSFSLGIELLTSCTGRHLFV